jgi:adenylyltransferase/sulfurtransferase
MPLHDIVQQLDKIDTVKPVILYCRKGIRSQVAIQRLQQKFPFTNLFNLIGGTEAWKKVIG